MRVIVRDMDDATMSTRGMRQLEAAVGMSMSDYIRGRYAAGASQQEIADGLGVDRATVSRWMTRFGIEVRYVGRRRRGTAA